MSNVDDLFLPWPDEAVALHAQRLQRLYEQGFCGAKPDPAAAERLEQAIWDIGGNPDGAAVAHTAGYADSGAGKLIIPHVRVLKYFPDCWPGPNQERGDCVSHGTKNASLISLCGDIFNAKPDEETGQLEGIPEISEEGRRNGVLSSEWLYWWRGYNGDGWSGEAGAEAAIKTGIMLRQAYPELGIDLTRYSGALAGKYGRQSPPANMAAEGKKHHLRNVTVLRSPEEVRDFLHNFYGVTECSTLAGSQRDENGVSRLKTIGGHCQCISGYDDRDEIKQKYGEPLALITNSWGGNWISGGRKILGTDIEIPEGSHWFKASQLRNMSLLALSSVAGWPSRRPPPPPDLFT